MNLTNLMPIALRMFLGLCVAMGMTIGCGKGDSSSTVQEPPANSSGTPTDNASPTTPGTDGGTANGATRKNTTDTYAEYVATFRTPSGEEDLDEAPNAQESEQLEQYDKSKIFPLLSSRKTQVRIKAAKALRFTSKPPEGMIDALCQSLLDPVTEVRQHASRSLAYDSLGGKLESAIPALIKALGDPDDSVAINAATALGQQGELAASASSALAANLTRDNAKQEGEDMAARIAASLMSDGGTPGSAAAEALGEIGDAGKPYINQLRSVLTHRKTGAKAAASLARLGDGAYLISQVGSLKAGELAGVLEGLGAIQPTPKEVYGILITHSDSTDEAVKKAAVHSLGAVRPTSEEVVAALGVALRKPQNSQYVRQAAAEAFAQLDPKLPSAVEHLTFAAELKGPNERRVRDAAVKSLGLYPVDPTQQILLALGATNEQGLLSYQGANQIAKIKDAILPLSAIALDSSQPQQIRLNALNAASRQSSVPRDKYEQLLRSATEDASEPIVAAYAAVLTQEWAVRQNRGQDPEFPQAEVDRLTTLLLAGIDAKQFDVRRAVINTLAALRSPKAAVRLTQLLANEKEPGIRADAAHALGEIGPVSPAIGKQLLTSLEKSFDVDQYHESTFVTHLVMAIGRFSQHANSDAKALATALVAAIGHKSAPAYNRAEAVKALGQFPSSIVPQAIKTVEESLTDSSTVVRIGAANALRAWGEHAKAAAPALVAAIQGPAPKESDDDQLAELRGSYLHALAAIQADPNVALPVFKQELANASSFQAAAFAVAPYGAKAAPLVPDLLKGLESSEANTRRAVVEALGAIGPAAQAAAAKLRTCMDNDPNRAVGYNAFRALLAVRPTDPDIAKAVSKRVFSNTGRSLLSDEKLIDSCVANAQMAVVSDDPELAKTALTFLTRLNRTVQRRYLPAFTAAMESDTQEVRGQAALLLAEIGERPDGLADALLTTLTATATDKELQRRARYALGNMSRDILPQLASVLKSADSSADLKAAVCQLLADQQAYSLQPQFVAASKSEHGPLKGWATIALAGLNRESVETTQLLAGMKSPDAELRRATVRHLAADPDGALDPQVVVALIAAFKDEDRSVASSAATYLGRAELNDEQRKLTMGAIQDESSSAVAMEAVSRMAKVHHEYFPLLIAGLKSDDQRKRRAASQALQRGGPAAVAPLMEVIKDAKLSDDARRAAMASLAGMPAVPKAEMRELAGQVVQNEGLLRWEAAATMGKLGVAHPKVFEALVEGLDTKDYELSDRIQSAFQRLGPQAEPAAEALIRRINGDAGSGQAMAARLLPVVAPTSTTAIEAIIDQLGVKNNRSMGNAIMMFGEPAVPALLQAMESEDLEVTKAAIAALGRMGDAAKPAVSVLQGHLTSSDSNIALASALALSRLAPETPGVMPPLVEALQGDGREKSEAIYAISDMGEHAAPAIDLLVGMLDDPRYSPTAIAALGNMGELASPAVSKLVDHLKETEHAHAVCSAIGQIGAGATAAAPALMTLLNDKEQCSVAAAALAKLGEAGEQAIPSIVKMLDREETLLQGLSCLSAFKQRAATAVPTILALFDKSDQGVQIAAIRTLGQISPMGDAQVTSLLIPLLEASNRQMASQAASALGEVRGDAAASALIELLASPSAPLSRAAGYALTKFEGNEQVVTALVDALDRPELQMTAAMALAGHNEKAAPGVARLQDMLQSDERDLRLAAVTALRNIGVAARPALPLLAGAIRGARDSYERSQIADTIWSIDAEYAAKYKLPKPNFLLQ